MSRCLNCRRALPDSQTLCRKCYEDRYAHLGESNAWWKRLKKLPRLTRVNISGFLLWSVCAFIMWRFDFPYFHPRHMLTTPTSAWLALLLATVAFLVQGER